jgi:hypothetical protein
MCGEDQKTRVRNKKEDNSMWWRWVEMCSSTYVTLEKERGRDRERERERGRERERERDRERERERERCFWPARA